MRSSVKIYNRYCIPTVPATPANHTDPITDNSELTQLSQHRCLSARQNPSRFKCAIQQTVDGKSVLHFAAYAYRLASQMRLFDDMVDCIEYCRMQTVVRRVTTCALFLSTASMYWVRSLVPIERKSTRSTRAAAKKIAEGASIITSTRIFVAARPSSSSSR